MKQSLFTNRYKMAIGRSFYLLNALLLTGIAVITAINPMVAHATTQITARSITMSSSKVSQASTTFNVSFKPTTVTGSAADDIKGIVVQFCQNSPLVAATCTLTNGVTASPTTSTVAVSHTGATGTPVSFTVNAASVNTGLLILTHATGLDIINASNPITFIFTATNPSALGTFYARILTYNTTAGAAAYTDTVPGTHLDEGGIALSTARQLTVAARVQEQLEFCVSAITSVVSNATTPANCAAFPATTLVDLGVVDSTATVGSPVSVNGGNSTDGGIEIRTNASSGAVISYFAEQDTSSGKLKVPGATCSGVSTTDQCFNSAGTTQVSFASEGFGMTISNVYQPTGSTTTNLLRNTNYDGSGATVGVCVPATVDSPNCWAWVDSGTNTPLAEPIASSTTVMDYEYLRLRFAARAAATTPTGSYQVTSTYIATATY